MVKRFDCQVAVTVSFQLRFELSESRKRVGKQTVEQECQLFYGPAYNLVLVVCSTCCGSSAVGLAGVVLGRRSASGRLLICWGQLKPETDANGGGLENLKCQKKPQKLRANMIRS